MVVESAIKIRGIAIHSAREFSFSTPGELLRKYWMNDEPDHISS